MFLHILVLLCVAFAEADQEDEVSLQWADQYTFTALKISLISGLTQELQYWRMEHKSREDYNKDATKIFKFDRNKTNKYGVKYEVHPVFTDDHNKIVCEVTKGTKSEEVESKIILPDADDFESIGKELLVDRQTTKFLYKSFDDAKDLASTQTLWAEYDNETKLWIPVRFEDIEFNTWFGNPKKRDIWEFYTFETKFDDKVFDVKKYECSDNEVSEEYSNSDDIQLDVENEDHVDQAFERFKTTHGKSYDHELEHAYRRTIFQDNLRHISSTNKKNLGYKLAVNKFSDRTPAEMKKSMGLKRRNPGERGNIPFPYTRSYLDKFPAILPTEYDLRLLGYVAPVIDQGDCGCCWTMGTTAAMEGALARANGGRLLRLSNQALIDCAYDYADGCDGGSDTGAYQWMMQYGLPTVEEYGTYTNQDNYCAIDNMTTLYPIRGYTDVTPFSVEGTKVALINHGPLSVSVHVTEAFQSYSSGIFYDPKCEPTELDHEVTLVGYGVQDDTSFWILKNSWGTDWGIGGYMHISTADNACGVTTEPTYPVI